MGVSMIRGVPNSCTSPTSVLNGCPASATSSPMRNTRGSRRISSAIASLTPSPYVSSRSLMTPSVVLGDRASREARPIGARSQVAMSPSALESTKISFVATADEVPAPPAAELSLADAMAYARELQLQGRLQAADELYGRILALAPDYADAWHSAAWWGPFSAARGKPRRPSAKRTS